MHENTKITLRQIVGAGKVQGRVVDEPREGPKMRTNLSILGWFIKSMSLSYHPTRVSWLFREIENTWSRTTVDWSLTVFLAFPPEGTLICSWVIFFVTAHKFPCFEVGHQQPGQERRGVGWRRSRRVHFHQLDIFLHLHNPPQTWEQTKSNSQGWFSWFHLDLVRKSKRRLLAMRGRKVMKTGKKMCIVPAISLSDIWVTHLLWNTWSDCHVSFNTGSNMGYFSRIPSESHILPLPSIPCTMHICVDTTMLTEMEFWPAQRLQRFFKLTTKNPYLSTTYCIKLSSHTVQWIVSLSSLLLTRLKAFDLGFRTKARINISSVFLVGQNEYSFSWKENLS